MISAPTSTTSDHLAIQLAADSSDPAPNIIRKIIHIDMDAFYASVEIRDNPKLAGHPVVVGGSQRGVVLTANYEARRFGIHSAMPGFKARKLCPQLICVPPRFAAYQEASAQVQQIFATYTAIIEPRSLDEAFLDVTDNPQGLLATKVAQEIQQKVWQTTHLSCSAGVASNKLLAKIGSDFRKPGGITVVQPHEAAAFMAPLKLRKIPGIGPASEKRLAARQLFTCQDIVALGHEGVTQLLGWRFGHWLWRKAHGEGSDVVGRQGSRKSLGMQRSIGPGPKSPARLKQQLQEIVCRIVPRLQSKNLQARTITLRLRMGNFQDRSRSLTLPLSTADQGIIQQTAHDLLDQAAGLGGDVRMVGLTLSGFS